jgi:hypothetical protein
LPWNILFAKAAAREFQIQKETARLKTARIMGNLWNSAAVKMESMELKSERFVCFFVQDF